jgi:DnaK suppressor protein
MPTKRAAAKPAKPKKAEKPKLTAKKPAAKPVAAKTSSKSAPVKAPVAAAKPAPKPAPAPAAAKPAPAASATPVAQAIRKAPPSERIVVTATGVPSSQSAMAASARANPADDGDDNDSGSLLAGPRNVTPYIAKRGEQYMNAVQLEHFRNILNGWKRDLMEEVDRTVSHMLKRVEDGSYGYCLETGEEIGVKRLEARPVATLTIEAQERRERRERQYGDRDDRYR